MYVLVGWEGSGGRLSFMASMLESLLYPLRLPVDVANSVKEESFPRLPGVWAQSYALNWPIPVKKAHLGALVVFKPPPCSISLGLSLSFVSLSFVGFLHHN